MPLLVKVVELDVELARACLVDHALIDDPVAGIGAVIDYRGALHIDRDAQGQGQDLIACGARVVFGEVVKSSAAEIDRLAAESPSGKITNC